jgi:hypothetical protein
MSSHPARRTHAERRRPRHGENKETTMTTLSLRRMRGASGRPTAALALVAVLAALSGCGVWQSLSVRDDEAPSVALRAAVRPQGWARSERPGPGFEIGYERHRAKDVRTLAAGESITLDTQVVTGPDTMGQNATVQLAHVAYTHPLYFGGYFELEPFGGVAQVKVRYRAEPASSALRPELNTSRTSVIGGITPRLRLNEWVAVEARFCFVPRTDADVYGRSVEVSAVLTPVRQLALRLGYAQRRYGADFNIDTAWTQLDVRSSGPFAALQFEF